MNTGDMEKYCPKPHPVYFNAFSMWQQLSGSVQYLINIYIYIYIYNTHTYLYTYIHFCLDMESLSCLQINIQFKILEYKVCIANIL